MGFADAITGRLFCTRRRSDLEVQIQSIMERKLAVLDECNRISAEQSNFIFQNGQHGTISQGTATPGNVYPSIPGLFPTDPITGNPVMPQDPFGTGTYEAELAVLQNVEKELEVKQNKLETELEAVKAEEESLKKIADDHAKKDFKVG